MTQQEFDSAMFGKGDKAKYKDGETYPIAQLDFDERLIGLLMEIPGGEEGDVSWVRCENIEYIPC